MPISIRLSCPSENYVDEVIVKSDDNRCFSYYDNEGISCKMHIFDDGLFLLKKSNNYELELNLRNDAYALIRNKEGELKLAIKVVDFSLNNDILVMHYLLEGVLRIIEITFNKELLNYASCKIDD